MCYVTFVHLRASLRPCNIAANLAASGSCKVLADLARPAHLPIYIYIYIGVVHLRASLRPCNPAAVVSRQPLVPEQLLSGS